MHIHNEVIEKMLNAIPDEQVRKTYSDIVSARATHLIRCLSDECKGRVIGFILSDGTNQEDLLRDEDGQIVSGLMAHRKRLDGEYGFQCFCGNDSRLSEHEQGIIGRTKPSAEALMKVATNINDNPTRVKKDGKVKEVDGFALEGIN